MGTRGAIGYHIDGEDKVTYNHFDSYPSGLGVEIMSFIKKTPIKEIREMAPKIEMINERDEPTEEHKKRCIEQGTVNLSVSSRSYDDYYCLLRNAQGSLDASSAAVRGSRRHILGHHGPGDTLLHARNHAHGVCRCGACQGGFRNQGGFGARFPQCHDPARNDPGSSSPGTPLRFCSDRIHLCLARDGDSGCGSCRRTRLSCDDGHPDDLSDLDHRRQSFGRHHLCRIGSKSIV